MAKVKIGLIREGKVPVDHRVALSPAHAAKVAELYPEVEIVAQRSDIRCFADEDYQNAGVSVVESLEDRPCRVEVAEGIVVLAPAQRDRPERLLDSELPPGFSLQQVASLALSSGSRLVYAVSPSDDSLGVFARDLATGLLTPVAS